MKKLLILLLLPVIFILSNCSKCKNEQISTMSLSKEDLWMVPYKDKDTLRFIGSNSDTLILNGYRIKYSSRVFEHSPGMDRLDAEICGMWYNTEYDLTFFGNKEGTGIFISLNLPNLFYQSLNYKRYSLELDLDETQVAFFEGDLQYGDSVLTDSPVKDPSTSCHIESINDTVRIGPNTYYKVYKIVNTSKIPAQYTDWIQNVYYNTSQGLVGFSLKNGRYYYLLLKGKV